jgi:hypothetical protein
MAAPNTPQKVELNFYQLLDIIKELSPGPNSLPMAPIDQVQFAIRHFKRLASPPPPKKANSRKRVKTEEKSSDPFSK